MFNHNFFAAAKKYSWISINTGKRIIVAFDPNNPLESHRLDYLGVVLDVRFRVANKP